MRNQTKLASHDMRSDSNLMEDANNPIHAKKFDDQHLAHSPNQKEKEFKWRKARRANVNSSQNFALDNLRGSIPFFALLMGGCIAAFQPFDTFGSVLATAATGLVVWALTSWNWKNQQVKNNASLQAGLQERFEDLEDKAWELSESEERYRNIAQAFGDIMVMRSLSSSTSQAGQIIDCNEKYTDYFGKTVKEVIDTNFSPNLIESEKLETFKSNSHANKSNFGNRIKSFQTPNGVQWFDWLDLPVRDPKTGQAMMLSVARNITAFKQAELTLHDARQKAESANQAKSRFLGMVSHEMRTPLNGILGISKLLEGTKLTKEQENYVHSINSSGKALLSLIEEMLDLTMIEAGKFKPKNESFSLHNMVEELSELLSERAFEKGIGLGVFIDQNIESILYGDRDRLRQIILNLVGNAIKFTQEGAVALRVLQQDENDQSAMLRFEIEDTGPGLSRENQQRIFKEFERLDDESTRQTEGAGLGLTISKALAEQLGAKLSLANTSESGSIFQLDIEVKKSSNPQSVKASSVEENSLADTKLALIGHHQLEAKCQKLQLEQLGADVSLFETVEQFRRLLANEETKFSALLIDAEECSRLKDIKKKSACRDAKKIATIKPSDKIKLKQLRKEGVDSYVINPIRLRSLVASILGEHEVEKSQLQENEIRQLDGMNILLAEDNPINALLAKNALEKNGAKVFHVENGVLAIEAFKKSQFDLVLMDMHMPIMDGISATVSIRNYENESNLAKIPIVALSADEQKSVQDEARQSGVTEFLTKPIDPNKLVQSVHEQVTANKRLQG